MTRMSGTSLQPLKTLSLYNLIPRSLLLHYLRLGLGAETDGLNAGEGSDWNAVYEMALRQDVLAFVFDGYAREYEAGLTVPDMPVALKKQWIGAVMQMEAKALRQQQKSEAMARLFAENGIRTYVLKGRVISECYPRPEHRLSADMDCFLLPADETEPDVWEKGNSLMEEAGHRVSRSFYKNSSFHMKGLMVENHRFLTPFRGNKQLKALEMKLQSLLRADKGTDKFEGTNLYRPPVLVSALFLIEHAYSHFLHEGLTLKHITDWMMFLRRHGDALDWKAFDEAVDTYGFRRFYDAYVHVGEFVMGTRRDLSAPEQRMMDSVWEGLDLHDTVKGVKGKLNLVGNTLRAAWKYRLFSPISMPHALWIQVKGVLFQRHPVLKLGNNNSL